MTSPAWPGSAFTADEITSCSVCPHPLVDNGHGMHPECAPEDDPPWCGEESS